jgi:hypothetical protein
MGLHYRESSGMAIGIASAVVIHVRFGPGLVIPIQPDAAPCTHANFHDGIGL